MDDKTSKIASVMKMIADHKATKISNVLNRVKITFYVFEANYNELNRWLRFLENEKFLNERMNTYKDPVHANAYCDELARLVHNYLGSAFCLVDHTRNMINELYEDERFLQEYQKKLNATLATNPLRKFIQDLRDYLTHYYVPIIDLYFHLNEKLTCESGFAVKELELWDGWTALSKSFMKGKKSILLKPVIEEHFTMVSEFYAWLAQRQSEIHKPEMEEVLKLVHEYDNLLKETESVDGLQNS